MEDRIADLTIAAIIATIIVLKLTNVITVSWLWLTAIIWIPFLIGVMLAISLGIVFGFEMIIYKNKGEKR